MQCKGDLNPSPAGIDMYVTHQAHADIQGSVQHEDSGATDRGLPHHALPATNALPAAVVRGEPGGETGIQDSADKSEHSEAQDESDPDSLAKPILLDIQEAAAQLSKLTGLQLETALNALKETQESVFGQASSVAGVTLVQTWLEEAQVWLACNMEVQEEIDDVRLAMQESLQEFEAAKAADDVPLTERPPDYLHDRFLPAATGKSSRTGGGPGSIVFRCLSAFACYHALFADGDHKAPLVKLAELECKCHRWYPSKGTMRFWELLGEECATVAAEAGDATLALQREGWVACGEGPDHCGICAAALGKSAAGTGPSTSAPMLAASGPSRSAVGTATRSAVLAALGAFAALKVPEMEEKISKMPSVSGQIPDVFVALGDPPGCGTGSDAECIELLDSESGSER
ncbi:hypothetical protein Vretimale_12297 [Volvox reticuliferus]|uniref:Uncharacterized protein n=2 Tax=Volvox reticuliferus TaxID=1737510 RepID=A0A8J4CC48_9CHLO|nr:hypothetical protein Vretifemale_8912 [Volvox reticuliferus]GIM08212.1 hypothetical protein Vretimale_12297 [Volvox reticuliferus]